MAAPAPDNRMGGGTPAHTLVFLALLIVITAGVFVLVLQGLDVF